MSNIDLARLKAQRRLADAIAEDRNLRDEAIESTNYLAESQRVSLASEFAQHILSRVRNVNSQLDESQEVVVNLLDDRTNTFSVSGVGYINPSLMIFTGFTEDGKYVELSQHVSRTNCALIVRPKLNPEEPKRKIGFIEAEN